MGSACMAFCLAIFLSLSDTWDLGNGPDTPCDGPCHYTHGFTDSAKPCFLSIIKRNCNHLSNFRKIDLILCLTDA